MKEKDSIDFLRQQAFEFSSRKEKICNKIKEFQGEKQGKKKGVSPELWKEFIRMPNVLRGNIFPLGKRSLTACNRLDLNAVKMINCFIIN